MKINVHGKYKMNNDSLTEIVNLGGGVPLILSDGVIHRVKSLKAGTNVSLVDTGSEITINLTGGPGSSLVTSVNGESGDVVLTTADIDDSASVDKYVTQAQKNKIDFLTITQSVDLDALETKSNFITVTQPVDLNTLEADSHTHANKAALDNVTQAQIDKVNFITITQSVDLDALETDSHTHTNKVLLDTITDAGPGTNYLSDDGTYKALTAPPVDSVNGQTGVVSLDADDIDDSVTTNKFATAQQLPVAVGTITADGTEDIDLTNRYSQITKIDVGAITASTVTLSNAVDGGVYTIHFVNISTTVDVTWPVNVFTETGSALGTVQYTGGKMLTFYYDGTNFYTV